MRDDLFEGYARNADFIQAYVFPGGLRTSQTVPAKGMVVFPKLGRKTIPVYGRAYPEAAAYPSGITPEPDVALQYTLPAGQRYVLGGDVALDQLRQVEPGAEVFAFAVEDGRTHGGRQVLEGVAHREDEAVGQRVALGGTGEADDGDFAVDLEMDVFAGAHCGLRDRGIICYKR